MKRIGQADDGKVIVLLEPQEYRELCVLSMSVEGRAPEDIYLWKEQALIEDFSTVFGAIRAFYMASFRINAMQGFLDQMKGALNSAREQD